MRRQTWALAAAAVVVAMTVTGGAVVLSGAQPQARAAQPAAPNTVSVEKRTLTAMVAEPGVLTFGAQSDGSPYSVIDQASGTYTKLPAVGRVISPGQVLYRVNNSPVVLLRGSTPAYRTLAPGTSGPDVAELNTDLVTLGYATRSQLRPAADSFGSATTAAVEKLQAAVGLTQSGTLTLGQAVFQPTAVRVTSVSAPLGGRAHAGAMVLEGTSTRRQVQLALAASQQTDVAVGDKVSITLPNNHTSPGVVSSVGTVATCPPSSGSAGSGSAGSGSGSAAPGTDSCSSGSAGSSTPTIAVTVTPSHPAATGTWDQAPVQVGITTATVPGALVVPVTALLARSAGGYAVEVVGPGALKHLIGVSLGLFDDADGLVQVTGPGLAPGQRVVVPST